MGERALAKRWEGSSYHGKERAGDDDDDDDTDQYIRVDDSP